MSDLTPPGVRQPNAQEGFEAGQIVRPIEEVRALMPRLTTLRVKRARTIKGYCGGCRKRRWQAGRNRLEDDSAIVRAGELYAGTQEVSSWLCMSCVEPIPEGES